ncbi:putative reverse transcriptase domain-containing protein [Tanacetum coccineum]|uniref:Reverse transcriptase domain-containing protein n=1 Tax=Tanacetum coccineum TaxID=301880 RepID=A0ABQ5I416_9ASTR
MKCQPLFFKGTEGVVKLTQWFERMETVFRISNCTVENQIKFSTCTLLGVALTWWNSHVRTVGHDVAYAMIWTDLKKKMTNKYCPRSEIKKLNQAEELMDKKISTLAERQAENKRKLDNNNQAQQQSLNRQNVAQAYAAGTGERKEYAGTLPLCNICKLHHNGPCTIKYGNCKKIGHMTQDCRNPAAARNQITLTCYECGNPGHYKSDCPKLKNQNHGNQTEGTRARELGCKHWRRRESDQELNDIEEISVLRLYTFKIFFVLEKVRDVAYKLELPEELSRVHNTFHVSNLKKCHADEPLAVPLDGLHFDDKLQFVEEPVEIMDHEVKRLKRSRIPLVKVRWHSRRGPEFTWETRNQFKEEIIHTPLHKDQPPRQVPRRKALRTSGSLNRGD